VVYMFNKIPFVAGKAKECISIRPALPSISYISPVMDHSTSAASFTFVKPGSVWSTPYTPISAVSASDRLRKKLSSTIMSEGDNVKKLSLQEVAPKNNEIANNIFLIILIILSFYH